MKRIRFAALLLVASCNSHNSTSFKSADAAALTDAGSISDPSIADVAAARARILDRFPNPQVWFGPVAAPRNCADGNMSGEPVRACEVCALVLRAAPSTHWMDEFDLSVEKLTLFIPFKRAISYDQPDVTPVGNASGVWVPVFPQQQSLGEPTSLNFKREEAATLAASDLAEIHANDLGNQNYIVARNGELATTGAPPDRVPNLITIVSSAIKDPTWYVDGCNGEKRHPRPLSNSPRVVNVADQNSPTSRIF